jgi:hypothetical protein
MSVLAALIAGFLNDFLQILVKYANVIRNINIVRKRLYAVNSASLYKIDWQHDFWSRSMSVYNRPRQYRNPLAGIRMIPPAARGNP